MADYWCEDCYGKLEFLAQPPEAPKNVDKLLSCCYYSGRARIAVLRMKKGGYAYSCETFAVLMTELIGKLMEDIDFVTAVPTSGKRRRALGYAQAEKIAKNIAMRGRKRFRRVLKVNKGKKEQKQLKKKERLENARNAYRVSDNRHIEGKTILLVDDVTTTGATISAVAGLLKEAGAKSVYAVTFAKTR